MLCEVVDLGDGRRAILCGVRRRPLQMCAVCRTRPSERLCDGRVGRGRTCDKPLCATCAISRGKRDYCSSRHAPPEQLKLGGIP